MTFQNLKREYSTCQKCSLLCQNRTQVVFGSGNPDADVLFIGEAPGANEDKKGVPFCGMSGKILDELLQSINLSREEIFITNTILCRPPKNRNPTKEEVENCRERLDQLLELMKPKVIVTIGNFATDRIINKKEIKKIRGKMFNYKKFKVIPVVHPAAWIYSGRNPQMLEQMKDDFKMISEIINDN
ncbi:uracil-DNA glycosylase [Candidatus Woesearchaeota archaeon CG10_big_fil_rev_8_21_14_0_10_32_24]|nr:MAG: uracil-DNA glycosylase [Candidatus Woesearchaeota archaeon CG10_big_fil_rev_8_21_14_0_10_32_24]